MTIVSDNLKRVLRVTKSPNPDAADGNAEAWVNCDFCSNRREVCTKDTEWEPCPRCSTRPLAPVPTKPKECRREEPAVQFPNFHHIWCSGGGNPRECKTCARLWARYPDALSTDPMPHDVGEPCDEHGGFPVPAEFAGIIDNMPPVRASRRDLNAMIGKHTLKEVCEMRGVEYDPKQDPTSPEYVKTQQPTWETSRGKTVFIDEPSGQLPNCLQTADRLTSQDRNEAYGHPLDDYECTAALWTAILRHAGVLAPDQAITAELAIQCMVQVKLSRQSHQHKDDNLIDAAGYIRCLEMVRQERERRALAALDELTRLGQEQGGYE